jgi:hypothetical protein
LECKIEFRPNNNQVELEIQAILQEGTLQIDSADASLKDIGAEIKYQYPKEILDCSHVQASLLIGRASCMKEYPCFGSYLRFSRLKNSNIEWDVAVYDEAKECIRLVGYSQDDTREIKEIKLDPLFSHISSFYLEDFQFQVKQWSTIKRLSCKGYFDLKNLYEDIKAVPLEMSHLFLQLLRNKHLSTLNGKGLYTIFYEPIEQQYVYQLSCSSIHQENYTELHNGFLKIRQQSNKWIVDELRWDKWFLCAEIEPLSHKFWKVPFLGISHRQEILMGIEGVLSLEQGVFSGQIKHSQLDVAFINQKFGPNRFATHSPKGNIELLGGFEWNYLCPDNSLQLYGKVNVHQFQWSERVFFFTHPFEIAFKNQKFYAKNFSVNFFANKEEGEVRIFEMQFSSRPELHYLKGALHIAGHKLQELTDWSQIYFPQYLSPVLMQTFFESKENEGIQADFIFENHFNLPLLSFQITDGMFSFSKQKYLCQNSFISISANELQISSFVSLPLRPFQVKLTASWPNLENGFCTLHEDKSKDPLTIIWNQTSEKAVVLESIQGGFAGCTINLMRDKILPIENKEQESLLSHMHGEIIIPSKTLTELFCLPTEINFPLFFKGDFWIPKNIKNFWEKMRFFGGVYNEISSKKQLAANIEYEAEKIEIKNFYFQGNQESLNAPLIIFHYKEKKWCFYLPTLTVKKINFSTLTSLASFSFSTKALNFLVFKKIHVEELSGECQNIKTWKGKGSVQFVCPKKNEHFESFFALPTQQFLKIGITPHSLQPVTGTIEIYLKENRFYLTKLKNVFSEGRGVKFSLNKENSPFWVSLQGDFFLQLRIKKNHSLFKIHESFLLSLEGSIEKPHFTICPSSSR